MAVPLSGLPPLLSWRGSRTGGLRMRQPGELHGSDEHAAAQAQGQQVEDRPEMAHPPIPGGLTGRCAAGRGAQQQKQRQDSGQGLASSQSRVPGPDHRAQLPGGDGKQNQQPGHQSHRLGHAREMIQRHQVVQPDQHDGRRERAKHACRPAERAWPTAASVRARQSRLLGLRMGQGGTGAHVPIRVPSPYPSRSSRLMTYLLRAWARRDGRASSSTG